MEDRASAFRRISLPQRSPDEKTNVFYPEPEDIESEPHLNEEKESELVVIPRAETIQDPSTSEEVVVYVVEWNIDLINQKMKKITKQSKLPDQQHTNTSRIVTSLTRYSHFHTFNAQLREIFPDLQFPPLPPKTFFRNSSPDFIESRRQGLQTYLTDLLSRYPSVMLTPEFAKFIKVK
eukprot:TRINITY_DN3828_c0_g1_i2.p1 TRINITY_DN3828_c0_g1~~TRINITY_DN3828_c0_g1_i2.p1  ORF type:complete len:178 (+),score=4.47 TRINITY_DN3828_c0_g1_i2:88-621(+)